MTDPKKSLQILMILKYLPPLFSGAGKQAVFLAKALSKQGANVKMMSMVYKKQRRLLVDKNKEHIYNHMDFIRVAVPHKKKLKYIPFNLKIMLFLLCNRKKIDIIHLHSAWRYNFIVLFAAKILRIPIILKLTLMGDDDPLTLIKSKSIMRKMSGFSLKFFDAIICNSIALMESAMNAHLPSHKVVNIPNGVDLKVFKPVLNQKEKKEIRQSKSLPIHDNILLFIGRVDHRKGADTLFKVWEKIIRQYADITLVVIGPYSENRKDAFDDPSLDPFSYLFQDPRKKVIFLGPVDHTHDYIKSADLLFFPSRREGLPNVVLEALACGIPVIARRLEGVTDQIITESYLGILFDQEDTDFLCNQVLQYLDHSLRFPEDKNKRHAFIQKRYEIEKIARTYLTLYKQILC